MYLLQKKLKYTIIIRKVKNVSSNSYTSIFKRQRYFSTGSACIVMGSFNFATFILMCVFDLYILVIPLLLEFISVIPMGIWSVKRSKKIRKESAKPTIITLTAKNGEIYKDNIKLNLSYSVPKNIVYIDNGHRSRKFKFYTLSFSAIITGNEVNGFIDFCLKNKVRFLV